MMQLRIGLLIVLYKRTNIRRIKPMLEEKHHLNTKWYLSGDIKIRQQDLGDGRIGIGFHFKNSMFVLR